MYKQVDTHDLAFLANGVAIHPVATLEDGYGRAHIWVDDHCYQLGLEITETTQKDMGPGQTRVYIRPVTHIFPEAFDVLKTLPALDPA